MLLYKAGVLSTKRSRNPCKNLLWRSECLQLADCGRVWLLCLVVYLRSYTSQSNKDT